LLTATLAGGLVMLLGGVAATRAPAADEVCRAPALVSEASVDFADGTYLCSNVSCSECAEQKEAEEGSREERCESRRRSEGPSDAAALVPDPLVAFHSSISVRWPLLLSVVLLI